MHSGSFIYIIVIKFQKNLRVRHYYPSFTDEEAGVLKRLRTKSREILLIIFLIVARKFKSKQFELLVHIT